MATDRRQQMCLAAHDATDEVALHSALVLAPHPDDETIGCGATILRKVAAGTAVTVLVATDGRASHQSRYLTADELAVRRQAELLEATRRLGLGPERVRWYGLPDGTLGRHQGQLEAVIRALIAELAPAEVYVTSAFDTHPDHAALGCAARLAMRGLATRPALLEYPIWWWSVPARPRRDGLPTFLRASRARIASRRAHLVRVTADDYLPAKLHALRAHASQLQRPAEVPVSEPWPTLPAHILELAASPYELFFRSF